MRIVALILVVLVALAVWRIGMSILRALATPLPGPPPDGEMRKVKIVFRCPVCYAEVRMTQSPNAEPEAPRHCQAEMDLVTPVE